MGASQGREILGPNRCELGPKQKGFVNHFEARFHRSARFGVSLKMISNLALAEHETCSPVDGADTRLSSSRSGSLSRPADLIQIAPTTSPQFVRRAIAARAARQRYFASDLFADPAWDILLELYALECEQRRTSVSKLCIAAAVPSTTALRWIDKLYADGLLSRSADPLDGRRVWVSLSPQGLEAMLAYLESISMFGVPL